MKTKVKIVVEGGKATPAPPLGPQLTMLGLKPPEVTKKINDKTKDFVGMKVPVEIEVDKTTKEYEINVLMPSVSQLLIKAAGVEKGFGDRKDSVSISFDKVKKIAKDHSAYSLAKDERGQINEVLGTCLSLGFKVDDKDPRELIKKV
ncbi:MAG: ribosomal protein L11 [Candidatus Parvarchaeum acidophilus ARMAN-5]|jgi:large subunit ribosomal protein L11|uniref:Large ribosomal subunit protein uL11 n=1 Tax=Candidatus Parvarchaeum acidophilus ARMAN-5 TaxID=662762 RepID=D6GX18_PARA5|nr:MAG: ribosomal protein L11 [Candidatus Parvarchaeum acidophilus ARMAN-5]